MWRDGCQSFTGSASQVRIILPGATNAAGECRRKCPKRCLEILIERNIFSLRRREKQNVPLYEILRGKKFATVKFGEDDL